MRIRAPHAANAGLQRASVSGSGADIRTDWLVRLTGSGETAVRIWPDLIPEFDARCSKRFGDAATELQRSLEAIEHQIGFELPQGLPVAIL